MSIGEKASIQRRDRCRDLLDDAAEGDPAGRLIYTGGPLGTKPASASVVAIVQAAGMSNAPAETVARVRRGEPDDWLKAAKGITLAMLIALPLWALAAVLVYWLL